MDPDQDQDQDRAFLEHVLDKLYDFGKGPASEKKLKSQRKKKRKRCEREEEEEEEFPAVEDVTGDTDDTGAVGPDQTQQRPKTETGPTIQQVSRVEVVTYQDPRKKRKTKQPPAADKVPAPQVTETKQSDRLEELNLEKARLEVHRFGITGYKKEQQRVFEQDRAVMLGARPPKKDYVNYKILQQNIKEKKQKAKEEVQPNLKKKKPNNPRDKKKAAPSGSGTAPTGQMGRFKNGMLILSSKEIQKIKGNKRGK